MIQIHQFTIQEISPSDKAVLAHQGIKPGKDVPASLERLLEQARELFQTDVRPQGISADISIQEFARIYQGENRNDPDSPLEQIFPQAQALAVFILTMGPAVGDRISDLFARHDYALGYTLDTVASLAADQAAGILEQRLQENLTGTTAGNSDPAVLAYSPGYCGWHISGQLKLFAYLEPEQIGITLNDSYLMDPLKSVSGVLVAGPRESHYFKADYHFCATCRTHSCQVRIKALKRQATP